MSSGLNQLGFQANNLYFSVKMSCLNLFQGLYCWFAEEVLRAILF